LPVRGATAATSDIGTMSGMCHDMGFLIVTKRLTSNGSLLIMLLERDMRELCRVTINLNMSNNVCVMHCMYP